MAIKSLFGQPDPNADSIAGLPPISSVQMPSQVPVLPPMLQPLVTSQRQQQEQQLRDKIGSFENPNKPKGFWQNLRHTAATIGNVAGDIVAPNIMSRIPGTQLGNERLHDKNVGELKGLETQDKEEQSSFGENVLRGQQAAYFAQRPEIEQSKIDQKQTAAQQKIQQQAAARGQSVAFDADGVPTFTDNPELAAYHQAAAAAVLHQANAEKAHIEAEIKQNGYIPGTPEYERAMKQIAQKDAQIAIAGGNLGLRRDEFGAHAYGLGPNGQELPGALHDETGTTVGTWNAANVKPTTTARDAAARANTMTDIQGRIESGLNDPEIKKYLGPIGGRLAEAQGRLGTLPPKVAEFQNDLVSYGAFQAGLHPVRGIGALQYFDKVMGGLHQTPEQIIGKLRSNAATAGAVQQTGEMPTKAGQQRSRTAPNKAPVPGGGSTQKFTVDGRTFNIPADQVTEFKKDHPNAR